MADSEHADDPSSTSAEDGGGSTGGGDDASSDRAPAATVAAGSGGGAAPSGGGTAAPSGLSWFQSECIAQKVYKSLPLVSISATEDSATEDLRALALIVNYVEDVFLNPERHRGEYGLTLGKGGQNAVFVATAPNIFRKHVSGLDIANTDTVVLRLHQYPQLDYVLPSFVLWFATAYVEIKLNCRTFEFLRSLVDKMFSVGDVYSLVAPATICDAASKTRLAQQAQIFQAIIHVFQEMFIPLALRDFRAGIDTRTSFLWAMGQYFVVTLCLYQNRARVSAAPLEIMWLVLKDYVAGIVENSLLV